MTDRELMQQALEALELLVNLPTEEALDYADNAIDALRERLAQPEQEPTGKQHLQVEQPEQEPFALTFINTRMDGCKHRVTVFPEDFQENQGDLLSILKGQNVVALYTAPPQRKPLTDKEITRIGTERQGLHQVARAIEAAHGIKKKT